jgi:hypothetical protein
MQAHGRICIADYVLAKSAGTKAGDIPLSDGHWPRSRQRMPVMTAMAETSKIPTVVNSAVSAGSSQVRAATGSLRSIESAALASRTDVSMDMIDMLLPLGRPA